MPAFVPDLAPVVRTGEQQACDGTLYHLLQTEHEVAKTLQDRCYLYLVLASAGLFAAFVVSAATVTIAATGEAVHLFSAALDVSALLLVGWAFWKSIQARAKWIRQRTLAEFLRQWAATECLAGTGGASVKERYDQFTRRVRGELANAQRDTHGMVLALGRVRIREIQQAITSNARLTPGDILFYLARRPVRQSAWFNTSVNRIEEQQESRGWMMIGLFVSALLAGGLKLAALLVLGPHDGHALASAALFALLIFIGLAAASTSNYLGQNQRSLRHRYRSQLAAMENWFEDHGTAIELATGRGRVSAPGRQAVAVAVAAFERLMISELADWIAITGDDAMELAPA